MPVINFFNLILAICLVIIDINKCILFISKLHSDLLILLLADTNVIIGYEQSSCAYWNIENTMAA